MDKNFEKKDIFSLKDVNESEFENMKYKGFYWRFF